MKITINAQTVESPAARLSYDDIIRLSGKPYRTDYTVLHRAGCCAESVSYGKVITVTRFSVISIQLTNRA